VSSGGARRVDAEVATVNSLTGILIKFYY
jgi:hypothetical protein